MDISKLIQKIDNINKQTFQDKKVTVADMDLYLRPLEGDEEIDLQQATKEAEGIEFMMRTKKETLATAIYKIDDQVLPDFIELEPGKPKISRQIFNKDFTMKKWNQTTIDSVYSAYLVLQLEVQDKAKKVIKFDNADLILKYIEEDQIKRVQDSVDSLVQNQEEASSKEQK